MPYTDVDDTNNQPRTNVDDQPSGTDSSAIHDNISGEIAAIAEKAAPVNADLVVIEDSAAANAKKRVQVGNLPGGGGSALPVVDTTAIVKGSGDATKLVRIEADGVATSTTRVITMPDQDINLTPDTGSFAKSVDGLSDADTTTDAPNLNEVLKWDGSNWVPGAGATAAIFMTDVTDPDGSPTVTYESGTVPSNKVVNAVEYQSGELTVTIHGEVDGGPSLFTPVVTITGANVSGSPVPVTEVALGSNTRRYSFSQAITLTGAGTVSVVTADGGSHGVAFTQAAAPPSITTFTHGAVPGGQTRTKNGDTVSFSATFPAGATKFILENWQLHGTAAQTFVIADTDTVISDSFTVAGSDSADGNSPHTLKAHLQLASGANGTTKESTNAGLYHDSASPTVANISVGSYPVGQFALKGVETADCTSVVTGFNGESSPAVATDWSSIAYADTTGTPELTIPSSTTYAAAKTVTRAGGGYNESTTNYRIVVTKSYNGTTTTKNAIVKIAQTAPTLTMTGATTRLRSRATGGDKTYSLTLTGNQELQNTPTCVRDATDDGPALGAWSGAEPDKTWTNTITVQEDDTKNTGANTYSWGGILAANGAGQTVASIGTNPTYTIGGFEQRDIAMAQFDEYEPIGTTVTNKDNPNKLSCEAVGISVLTYKTNTTQNDGGREFTITDSGGTFDATGTDVRCTDGEIFNISYTLRISEAS